ncbi:sugar phosphate isomerase/epimerase family protein [Paenibacillus protaetiae]|uniref:Sugar phosphate isomerase/epimerase n=1 Tax=Paenibacillus protaetiae TaxID=2509456 RepID=A0A4P6EZH8_9BACL|nr:sugar phosphate isomerase/epimerase [Paenibacillus protaetiae]QAY68185.1 sugar phosphate isomerase/epimerase [Paenibacillus protaetiae]
MRNFNIGLQLYTLRNEAEADFEGMLRKVAALGYEGVEFAGYGGMEADKLRDLLQELGLQAIGSHISLANLEENLEQEIAYLKTIGAQYAICPWLPENKRDAETWSKLIVQFEQFGKRFREEGLEFAYHNHDFEFHVELEGQFVFDTLYNRVSSDLLKVEMDIGWVQFAGQDPFAYISKYAGRLPLLHLKDYRKVGTAMDTVELGRGELPLVKIVESAKQAEVKWLIVEQDNCERPPFEAVAESMQWLKDNHIY